MLQWKALIEEKRAKQNADKQRDVEQQQRDSLELALAEKRDVCLSSNSLNILFSILFMKLNYPLITVRRMFPRRMNWRGSRGRRRRPWPTSCAPCRGNERTESVTRRLVYEPLDFCCLFCFLFVMFYLMYFRS